MVILQGLLALLSRSAGTVLTSIFGWAVLALFGQTGQREKTLLSGVVGAAAVWPLLLIGVIFPKTAALALAFVPMSKDIPSWVLRAVWIGLALLVPFVVGWVFAARSRPTSPPEPFWKKLGRGVPLTLGLSAAFAMMLVIAPSLQVVSVIRKRRDEHVPLLTRAEVYPQVAGQVAAALVAHGLSVTRRKPPWWVSAPSAILRKMGGHATSAFVPKDLAYYRGPTLDFALYPSDVLLRGSPFVIARAQGIIAEVSGPLDVAETVDAAAQELEKKLKAIWRAASEAPKALRDSPALSKRVQAVLGEINRSDIASEDWRILYRQALQVDRAILGQPQLLELEGRAPAGPSKPSLSNSPVRWLSLS